MQTLHYCISKALDLCICIYITCTVYMYVHLYTDALVIIFTATAACIAQLCDETMGSSNCVDVRVTFDMQHNSRSV